MGLIIRNLGVRWPGGCVPFTVDKKPLDAAREQAIADAIAEWERLTGIRFVARDMQDNFVSFVELDPEPNVGGSSQVGMRGGQQFIRLNDDNDRGATKGTVIHEIGHALGLAHEHQRTDRGDHIAINRQNFSGDDAMFDANYEKRSDSVWMRVGDYDLGSIMHYDKDFGADLNVISVLDPTEPGAGQMGQRNGLSGGDAQSAAALLVGRGEVCQMSNSGQFQNTVAQIDFSAGWNVLAPYMILGVQYVLFLKTQSGRVIVRRVEGNGGFSDPVFDADWSSGWTHAVPYSVGAANYLLLYKRSTGDLHLHELKHDGKVGKRIADTQIDDGFTSILAYNILLSNYMFFLKSSNGIVKIRHVEWNGQLGGTVESYNWSSGWTTALTYKVGGDNFLFILKSSNGVVHIHRLTSEGKVGERVDTADLQGGFSHAVWLPITLSNYVLLSKEGTGTVHILRINGNGSVGSKIDIRRFRSGINAFASYGAWAGRYLLMMRS